MSDPLPEPIYAGVEIADSGTRMTATVALDTSEAGGRRATTRLPAPPPPDDAAHAVAELVRRVVAGAEPRRLAGVGVAMWGRVDTARGIVLSLPLAPAWDGFSLAATLAELLGTPVRLLSATNAGALAEARQGAARGATSLLYAYAGRTVTSAYVRRGAVVTGARGAEGQLGHVRVRDDGPRCSCGLHGHLEAVGSAQSIVRNLIGLASDAEVTLAAMHRISRGRPEAFTVAQVVTLAQQGDPLARRVLDEAAAAWAVALADVAALLDPDVIALAGPLNAAGDSFLADIRDALVRQMPRDRQTPTVVWAAHPLHGPLLGARLLAEDAAEDG